TGAHRRDRRRRRRRRAESRQRTAQPLVTGRSLELRAQDGLGASGLAKLAVGGGQLQRHRGILGSQAACLLELRQRAVALAAPDRFPPLLKVGVDKKADVAGDLAAEVDLLRQCERRYDQQRGQGRGDFLHTVLASNTSSYGEASMPARSRSE